MKADKQFTIQDLPEGLLRDIAIHIKREALCADAFCIAIAQQTLSSLMQNRVRTIPQMTSFGDGESLNSYVVLIGKSGKSRKSTACEKGMSLVYDRDVKTSTNFTPEAIYRLLDSQTKTAWLKNDEFRKIIGNEAKYNSGMESTLTEYYSGLRATNNRASNEKDFDRFISNFCLNYTGLTAPDWIKNDLTETHFKSGFLNRFDLVYVPNDDASISLDVNNKDERETYLADYLSIDYEKMLNTMNRLDDMLDEMGTIYVTLSDEAGMLLSEYNKNKEAELSGIGDYDESALEAVVNRNVEKIKRTAGILKISRLVREWKTEPDKEPSLDEQIATIGCEEKKEEQKEKESGWNALLKNYRKVIFIEPDDMALAIAYHDSSLDRLMPFLSSSLCENPLQKDCVKLLRIAERWSKELYAFDGVELPTMDHSALLKKSKFSAKKFNLLIDELMNHDIAEKAEIQKEGKKNRSVYGFHSFTWEGGE